MVGGGSNSYNFHSQGKLRPLICFSDSELADGGMILLFSSVLPEFQNSDRLVIAK